MKNKYSLGKVFKRNGKCPLKICDFTAEGKYLMHKVLRAVTNSVLTQYFEPHELKVGNVLSLPDGRKRLLLVERDTGYWEWTNPDDIITLSEHELDELVAEDMVNVIPASELGRRNNPERQSVMAQYGRKKVD